MNIILMFVLCVAAQLLASFIVGRVLSSNTGMQNDDILRVLGKEKLFAIATVELGRILLASVVTVIVLVVYLQW